MEEEFARQSAEMAIEEKKWQAAMEAKKKLELEVAEQSRLLQEALGKLNDRVDM